MKVLFRIFVVFGILDVVIVMIEYFGGYKISPKILVGLICLAIGSIGLLILKILNKR